MQASRICSRCGADLDAQAAFCSRCGQPVQGPAGPSRPYRSAREQLAELQRRLPGNLAAVPLELLAVVALMVASAIWLCVTVALHVHDVAKLFDETDGVSAPGLGLYALATLVILLALCCWLGFLAWRLSEGDPRARAVAFVPLVGYGLAVLFSNAGVDGAPGTRAALHSLDAHGAMPVATMLMCWAAALTLAIAPRNREFFGVAPLNGRTSLRYDPVRVARDVLIAFVAGVGAVGVMYVVAHLIAESSETSIGVKVLVIGALLIVVAAGVTASLPRLLGGDPLARATVTALVFGYLVLMAIVEGQDLALLTLLFVGLGALAYLWSHPAARVRFAPAARPQGSPHQTSPSYGTPPTGVPLYGATPADADPESNPNPPS